MVGKPPFYFFGDWFVIIVIKTFDKLSVSGTVGGLLSTYLEKWDSCLKPIAAIPYHS